VRVLASESREPIPTAFVSLLDEDGDPIRRALTNPQGRALFSLQRSGTYLLKVEMFGRATVSSPPLRLSSDSAATYVFEMDVAAIPIAGIQVQSDKQCRIRPQEGEELARVWEEARKALSIQSWTDEAGAYRFEVLAWDRALDESGSEVESETYREFSTTARNPIQSLPVDSLMSGGFIQKRNKGEIEYFGPDASILLSNLFLNTHCFRLVESGDRPGDLGLAFEPTGEEIPDIQGTLWMDRKTGHLKILQFEYANASRDLTEGVAGGRVDFERLPDGAWIVRRWWIRMPIRNHTWIFGRKQLVGIHETGQVVTAMIRH
jgi:hypothetical protein